MAITFDRLSKIFNALRPDTPNKSPILFFAFDNGHIAGALKLPRPLDEAIRSHDETAVLNLLKSGANPNLKTHFSGPAVNEAVETMDLNMVKIIVQNGGDVNATNMAGVMSLHQAVSTFRDDPRGLPVFDYLLANGARLDIKMTDFGCTPAEWAHELHCPLAEKHLNDAALTRKTNAAAPKP